jgi:hypothetical protein
MAMKRKRQNRYSNAAMKISGWQKMQVTMMMKMQKISKKMTKVIKRESNSCLWCVDGTADVVMSASGRVQPRATSRSAIDKRDAPGHTEEMVMLAWMWLLMMKLQMKKRRKRRMMMKIQWMGEE